MSTALLFYVSVRFTLMALFPHVGRSCGSSLMKIMTHMLGACASRTAGEVRRLGCTGMLLFQACYVRSHRVWARRGVVAFVIAFAFSSAPCCSIIEPYP